MLEIQGVRAPNGISVALCDMDGTAILCTDSIHFRATQEAMARLGVALDDAQFDLARGRNLERGIERILEACGREDLLFRVAEIAEEKDRIAAQMLKRLTRLNVPAADRATLKALRACGLRIALGTTSRGALDTLNRVGLISAFDAIVTGNEANDKAEIWRLALAHCGALPEEAIVIEDAQVGIDAATALGVRFSVGIRSGTLRATVRAPRLGDLIIRDC